MIWITAAFVLHGILAAATGSTDDERVTKNILEGKEEGYIVANMARIFSLRYDERVGRTFKLLNQNLVTKNPSSTKEEVGLLKLDKDTGVITTTQEFDREELCDKAEQCIIQVQAVMLPNEFFTMLNMDVIIEDKNDNAPIFPKRKIEITLNEEDYSVDDVINLDSYKASDKDIGVNGELFYELSDNPYFAIETRKDERGTSHLQLKVLAPPDHEETSSLELTLTATDGGEEPLPDSAVLDITIADSNDHDPVFDQQEYFALLRENEGKNHIVKTVHAEDNDSGEYGAVRYFIPKSTPEDRASKLARELLAINKITGEVTLKRRVDRETHNGLRVLIEAKDSDPLKPRIGKTWLRIQVEDVNDNAPVIKVNFIVDSVNMTGYIPESASIRTYVAYVKATDVDNGPNGKVTTKITTFGKHRSNKDLIELSGQFKLASDGLLATGRKLDRESFQYFIIELKSCDEGSPHKCTTQNITIIVLDINDNSPVFNSNAKAVMISENSKVNSFVINVQAEDEDAKYPPSLWKNKEGEIETSRNGIIRYSIIQGDTDVFEIDQVSGDIRLRKALDHEKQQEWKLIVEARDGDWQTSSKANCSILIRVADVNDNLPIFKRPNKNSKEVYATILREQVIMKIEAKDLDAGPNSKITYKILEQDGIRIKNNASTPSLFILNPNSGDLRLNFTRPNLTDYLGWHKIVLEAKDSGDPPMSATASLHVKITDELLPDPVNQAGFDEKYILLAAALGAASLILILVIVLIVLCRRKKDRKLRTYNCRNAEQKSNAWISAPINLNEGSFYQSKTLTSTGSTSPKKVDHKTRRNDAILARDKQKEAGIDQSKISTFKADSKAVPASVVLSSVRAVDRDSGRGDSDSENGHFTNIDETVTPDPLQHLDDRSPLRQHDDESIRTSELGPQCDENCRTQGHSDTCWMPSPASDSYYSTKLPKTGGLRYGMTASAPRLDVPTYYDYESAASRTNDYPTLQHLPSSGYYTQKPEYYRTMSPRQQAEQFYHGYEGELAPIEEIAPLNDPRNYLDPTYEADDISAQTRMTLSTTPRHEEDRTDPYIRAASRSSMASTREYPQTSWHGRPSWDEQFPNPPRVQRAPLTNNYVEFTHDYRPVTSPIPRVSYPRLSSSSSDQCSTRLPPVQNMRPGSTRPYECQNYANPHYYYTNDSIQNTGSVSIQQAQDIVDDVDNLLMT